MVSVKARNARDAATRLVQQALTAISEANANAAEVRKTLIYTPEGKDDLTAGWAESARKAAVPALQSARTRVAETRAKVEGKLKAARTVPESERATSAQVLAPVIAAAADDPTVLVRAYENRAAGSLADRLVLEDSIQACIDAGIGGLQFVELWQPTRAGLAETVYSEDEKTALADLAAIGGLEDYVSSANTALDAELHAIETGSDPMHTVGNVKAWHTVASYECALEAGTLDDAPNLVRQAEDVLAAESGESAGIGEDFEPQEIPDAVRQETEARRAAYAGVTGDGTV